MNEIHMQEDAVDPLAVNVISNRLKAVLQQQQAALVRTAFSSVVRESMDLACAVFDSRGEMIGQSVGGTPGHINSMATGMRHIVSEFPRDTLRPGDVLLTNDPWLTSGQINDITVATPVFRGHQLVAWFASCCHSPDIGGRILSAEANDVFEEGLSLPIMKFLDEGHVNADLVKIIRQNVRTPEQTVGDIFAQVAGNAVGGESLLKTLDEFGLDDIDAISREIQRRSEIAMRRAIDELPDGFYVATTRIGGVRGEHLTLKAGVTVAGDAITVDYAGSSPQSRYGINVVLNYTRAYTSFALKAAIAPDVPHNAGSFRPVTVTAPEGSLLNCVKPAPVASRHLVGHYLPSLIFKALTGVIPKKLQAESADAAWMTIWRAKGKDGVEHMVTNIQSGGIGGRVSKDGLSSTSFPSGLKVVPTEVLETISPIVQTRRALRPDSGGPGTYRGGLGQLTSFRCRTEDEWFVNASADRLEIAAEGVHGGGSGATGYFGRSDGRPLESKTACRLDPSDMIELHLPGGGGYGNPFSREVGLVLEDVIEGLVSIEAARDEYGVAVVYEGPPEALVKRPEWFTIDAEATAGLRKWRGGVESQVPM